MPGFPFAHPPSHSDGDPSDAGQVLIGAVSFMRLPVNLLPDIAFPRLMVWTTYHDVGPAEIEEFVTIPIEEAVATVPGVRRVHSLSREGLSLVTVEMHGRIL
ncbi:MAG: efflux RND transporter permease subunit [candidate division KSB1 bacterium]|nr:efflux RND transporter permease subunit [candidate division KSB1 bacterium]